MKTNYKTSSIIMDILYPTIMYIVIQVIVMSIVRAIIGTEVSSYMLCQIIMTIIMLQIMYFGFYTRAGFIVPARNNAAKNNPARNNAARNDPAKNNQIKNNRDKKIKVITINSLITNIKNTINSCYKKVLIISITILLLSFGLNNIILMSPLAEVSAGYSEANANFYGSLIVLEIVGSVILTPILEELVFRGIVFGRLRYVTGIIPSVIFSSLAFAMIHFNLVQFIYALIIGFALAIFMEWTDGLYGALCGHMVANFLAVIRTEFNLLSFTIDGSIAAWIISVIAFFIGVVLTAIICVEIFKFNKSDKNNRK